jgi:hypothetical protein
LRKILLAILLLMPGRPGPCQSDADRQVSLLRDMAYFKFGTGVLNALKGARFPATAPLTPKARPFSLDLDWKLQEKENTEGWPYRDWTAIVQQGVVARNIIFNPRYLKGSQAWFDAYFGSLDQAAYLGSKERRKLKDNERLIRTRSAILFLGWDEREVQLIYYPGDINFRGGSPLRLGPWMPGTPPDIRFQRRTDYKLVQNRQGLLALMNGAFYQQDNQVHYDAKGQGQKGGFGFDGQAMLPAQPDMGTIAFYRDGRMELATWENLKRKENIRTWVQNRFMVLENGKEARDAHPVEFCRFNDCILRAYLFRSYNGLVGYLWTAYLPPDVLAPIARKMGIKDLILTDIHSVISCTVFQDSGPKWVAWNFVPQFREVSRAYSLAVSLSQIMKISIQDDFISIAFKYGDKNYFGLFKKDAPEAKRARRAVSSGPAQPR